MGRFDLLRRVMVVAAVGSLLAACSDGEGAQPPSSAADLLKITTEQITLTVWDSFSADTTAGTMGAALPELDAEFNKKYPNIKIEHKGFPYNTYLTPTVRTAMTGREGPDIVQMWGGLVANDYKNGLKPLDGYLATDPTLSQNLLLLDSFVGPDGKTLAVPYTAYASTFGYHKEPFEKAGLDPTKPPKTWSEFLDTCDKLSAAGVTPIAAGWKDGFLHDWYQSVFLSQLLTPQQFTELTKLKLPFNSEPFRKSREYLLQMQQRNCFAKEAGSLTIAEAFEQFAAGKSAMFLWQGAPDPSWDGVFRPPVLPDTKVGAEVVDAGANIGWAITSWSKHPNEAWAYLNFMLGQRGQELMVNATGTTPNHLLVKGSAKTQAGTDYLAIVNTKGNRTITFTIPPSVQALNQKLAVPFMDKSMSVAELLEKLEAERLKVASKLE